jgi:hypothetical protein
MRSHCYGEVVREAGGKLMEPYDNEPRSTPGIRESLALILLGYFLQALYTIWLATSFSKVNLLVAVFINILPAVLYTYKKRYSFQQTFRLYAVPAKVILACFILGIVIPVIGDEVNRIMQYIVSLPPEFEEFVIDFATADSFVDWLLLIFGAVLVQVLLLATVFGIIVWRTGSIIPAIIIHALNNLFSLVFSNIDAQNLEWYHWSGHVSPVVLAVSACILFYATRWFIRLTEIDPDESQVQNKGFL